MLFLREASDQILSEEEADTTSNLSTSAPIGDHEPCHEPEGLHTPWTEGQNTEHSRCFRTKQWQKFSCTSMSTISSWLLSLIPA